MPHHGVITCGQISQEQGKPNRFAWVQMKVSNHIYFTRYLFQRRFTASRAEYPVFHSPEVLGLLGTPPTHRVLELLVLLVLPKRETHTHSLSSEVTGSRLNQSVSGKTVPKWEEKGLTTGPGGPCGPWGPILPGRPWETQRKSTFQEWLNIKHNLRSKGWTLFWNTAPRLN